MSPTWANGMATASFHGAPRRWSACDHLLHRLTGNAEFPRDVRLGEPVVDELPDHVAALAREPLRLQGVLECLGPDLPQPVERLLVICRLPCHAAIMTTPCCQCQQGVVGKELPAGGSQPARAPAGIAP